MADRSGLFAVPAPVRALFRLVPLRVYESEPMPCRAPSEMRSRPRLHVYGVDGQGLSCDPACLMWQTFLRIAHVDVDLVTSSPLASPDGSLPFLLPSSTEPKADMPLTGSAMARYVRGHASSGSGSEQPAADLEVYLALLTQHIRPAWNYALFSHPANESLLAELYLSSRSAIPLSLRLPSLRVAMDIKPAKQPPQDVVSDARRAFRALDTLLACAPDSHNNPWFFGAQRPGLFDAHVFSYTYPLLKNNPPLPWADDFSLRDCLVGCPRLSAHCDNLYASCWPPGDADDRAV